MNELNQLLTGAAHEQRKEVMQRYLYKVEGEKLIGELTTFFVREEEIERKRQTVASRPGVANDMMYGGQLIRDYDNLFKFRVRTLKDLLVDILGITEQGESWSYAFSSPSEQHLASDALGRYQEVQKVLTELVSKL